MRGKADRHPPLPHQGPVSRCAKAEAPHCPWRHLLYSREEYRQAPMAKKERAGKDTQTGEGTATFQASPHPTSPLPPYTAVFRASQAPGHQ
ncbi:hypothetical protein NDU88_001658 [Pleurodeles waltl]|uniref:Uncharacterized protein n=1 Tax=Pleurodeles waltl TaxID=8319 RepID=A0AAV7MLJ7_PLEWA|nr:hypothetical protein NDU88_001658 [Pleurodeles waltl]